MSFLDGFFRARQLKKLRKSLDSLLNSPVSDFLFEDPQEVMPSASVDVALHRMVDGSLNSLIVLDGTKLVGVLREKCFVSERVLDDSFLGLKVSDIMLPPPPVLSSGSSLKDVFRKMLETKQTEVVVDLGGNLGLTSLVKISQRIDEFSSEFIENSDGVPLVRDFSYSKASWVFDDEPMPSVVKSMMGSETKCVLVHRSSDPGLLRGLISGRELMSELDHFGSSEVRGFVAKNIMRHPVEHISPDKDLFEANLVMLQKGLRKLPVLDGEVFLGVITPLHLILVVLSKYESLSGESSSFSSESVVLE